MSPLILAILLFLVALGLGLLDILVPSGGVLLVLSAASAIGSVLFGFRSGTTTGMIILTIVIGAVPIVLLIALRLWEHTPLGRLIVLKPPADDDQESALPNDSLRELVGHVGITQGSLMPTGHVRINHRNYNATTQGEIIEHTQYVEVVDIRERNLLVRATSRRPEETTKSSSQPATNPKSENLLDLPADQLGLDSINE